MKTATLARLVAAGYAFEHAFDIQVARDPDGQIQEDHPHLRYPKREKSRLVPGGDGPFCQFPCPGDLTDAGVYAICVGDSVTFLGATMNGLTQRFGSEGYGRIHPRNCFAGGQPTNVRVNHAILVEAQAGHKISVWFLALPPSDVEIVGEELQTLYAPAWNGRNPS